MKMGMNAENLEAKETSRLEAFSDGVFAFAVTLLVLGLKDPVTGGSGLLLQGLVAEWPGFFAFVTSFVTVLIMWMNHHNMFNYIRRIDRRFMFLNGILLLFVTLTPFTTALVAEHIMYRDAGTAAAVYSGGFLLTALAWNVLRRHASGNRRLLGRHVTDDQARAITRQYYVGPSFYAVAFLSAFLSGLASVVIILLVAAFYAITTTTSKRP